MPVTTYPAGHGAEAFTGHRSWVSSSKELFEQTCYSDRGKVSDYLQSSFAQIFPTSTGKQASYGPEDKSGKICSASNGFLQACIRAYFRHHHLILRPDDVWFSILTQLNMFVRGNAEALRSKFVAHEGKKELVVLIDGETGNERDPLNFAKFPQDMTETMQANIEDKDLRDWLMPSFSTTTDSDRVVASIVFMGAMSKYFTYTGMTACGLPSVTLLGTKRDWEIMLEKIGKIPEFGNEPRQWYQLLLPVLKMFVETFEHPSAEKTKEFWGKITHHHQNGSGQPDFYSGWLTAFAFWTEEGKCLFKEKEFTKRHTNVFSLDGVRFHRATVDDLTQGWVSVDVKVDDTYNGHGIYPIKMYAGSVGLEFEASGDNGDGLDTVRPLSGWWAYKKAGEKTNKKG